MANPEKHKKNLIEEWSEGDAGNLQVQSGAHAEAASRTPKSVPRRSRLPAGPALPAPPEPALIREPAPPQHEARHSQASSPEHLRKLEKLPKLRAPYAPKAPARARGFKA